MAIREYKTIKEVVGPLVLIESTKDVTYDELVHIQPKEGRVRIGKVLEVSDEATLVQLFEGSQGLKIDDAKAIFLGRGLELGVSPDIDRKSVV